MAFNQLNVFREMVDRFLNANGDNKALGVLVGEFETWARQNAKSIIAEMPAQATLDIIRPQWLAGVSLRMIIETCGDEAGDICNELYGYQLSWLLHSIAQKLDKTAEENRIEVLSKAGLMVELGLPTEAAAKVFLAGVRSRAAAVDLSRFVADATASVSSIRNALLDPATIAALSQLVFESTHEWLLLLSTEHGAPEVSPPECAQFSLKTKAPDEVKTLHVRRRPSDGQLHLCSTDSKFKIAVRATEKFPFERLADDPSFVFVRNGDNWNQHCRYPRIQTSSDLLQALMG